MFVMELSFFNMSTWTGSVQEKKSSCHSMETFSLGVYAPLYKFGKQVCRIV